MTLLTRALSSALLHFLWQGLVVALLLSVVLFLLRRRSAQARYLASCAALGIMAVLPAVTMWAQAERKVRTPLHVPPAIAVNHELVPTGHARVSPFFADVDAWALPAWSFGVLFFALRLMWGSRQVSVLRRRGEPAEYSVLAVAASVAARLGLSRPVHVLMSSLAEGPGVVGWLRPVILLPAATLAGLTPEQFEAVLAHEIAHILRYDYLVNLIQMLVEALLFYHPAVWWVSARIRHERELCCDDLAVRACGDAVCYARALTSLERLRAAKLELEPPALAMGSTSGRLLYRIERLMGVAPQEQSPARWPGIVALAAGLTCFALTTNWARGQAVAPPDQPGVRVDLGKFSVLNRTGVTYPEAAQKKGVRGNVTVQVTVDENGNVSDARVVSGPEELRKSVLQSVLNWKFSQDAGKTKRQVSVAFQPPPPGSEAAKEPEIAAAEAESQALIERMKARYEALQRAGVVSEQQGRQVQELDREQRRRELEETLAFLQQRIRDAEVQTERVQQQAPEDINRIYEAEAQLKRAQRQMDAAKEAAALAQADQAQATQNALRARQAELQAAKAQAEGAAAQGQAALAEVRARQAQMQAQLEQLEQLAQRRQRESRIVGRTLKNIQMVGFTEGVTNFLTSGLKLHAGDTLTPESIDAARKAVRDYDENVTVEFVPTDDGQVELRITEVAARR